MQKHEHMTRSPHEYDLLDSVARRLSTATALSLEPVPGTGSWIDGQLVISMPDGPRHCYSVALRRNLRPASLGAIVLQLRELPQPALLVADYVNPNIAERLADERIEFMDAAGNAYLNQPGLFVWVKGQKPAWEYGLARSDAVSPLEKSDGFKPSSLYVIFALLCKPGLESAPYREIAASSNVALGSVNWAMRELRERGYLYQKGRNRRQLIRKSDLRDRWVASFIDKLRPKLRLGRFTMLKPTDEWWRSLTADEFDIVWSGEIAAWKMTGYLRPERATLYADNLPRGFLNRHRLARSDDGEIQISRRFWGFVSGTTDRAIAPPLLVYADLVASGESRNLETAKLIHERYLSESESGQ